MLLANLFFIVGLATFVTVVFEIYGIINRARETDCGSFYYWLMGCLMTSVQSLASIGSIILAIKGFS